MFAIFLFDDYSVVSSSVQKIIKQIPNSELSDFENCVIIKVPWNEAVSSGLFEIAARCLGCSYLPENGGFFVPAYRIYGQKVLKSDTLLKSK